jgi:2-isopropylmalate synthase
MRTYKSISCLLNVPNELTEFAVKSVTEGIDAIGEVTVRIDSEGQTFVGRGGDTDIIVASAKALLNALNHLLSTKGQTSPAKGYEG